MSSLAFWKKYSNVSPNVSSNTVLSPHLGVDPDRANPGPTRRCRRTRQCLRYTIWNCRCHYRPSSAWMPPGGAASDLPRHHRHGNAHGLNLLLELHKYPPAHRVDPTHLRTHPHLPARNDSNVPPPAPRLDLYQRLLRPRRIRQMLSGARHFHARGHRPPHHPGHQRSHHRRNVPPPRPANRALASGVMFPARQRRVVPHGPIARLGHRTHRRVDHPSGPKRRVQWEINAQSAPLDDPPHGPNPRLSDRPGPPLTVPAPRRRFCATMRTKTK